MFYLPSCPYCRAALSWNEELRQEDPRYRDIELELIDEKKNADLAATYDYYYVPTYYVGEEKLHEGAATKEKVRAVFEAALAG